MGQFESKQLFSMQIWQHGENRTNLPDGTDSGDPVVELLCVIVGQAGSGGQPIGIVPVPSWVLGSQISPWGL